MAVADFNSETWKYVVAQCEDAIVKQTSKCIQPGTSQEDTLVARGAILALKQLMNLPHQHKADAANTRR